LDDSEEETDLAFEERVRAASQAFESHFSQPPDQRGGVDGTIDTFLGFFLEPEVSDVFCADHPTFSIGEMDQGKIVCIALPQKYQTERLYINTVLKLSYYFHAFSRFDKSLEERKKDNLLILFADEGQEILTGAESAFADHRAAGVIREAKCTIVLAIQAYSALLAALDKRYADVFMLNMSNEIIMTVADQQSAEIASRNIGEREIINRTWSWGRDRSFNYSRAIEPIYKPWELRKLPKFTAILRHCEEGHRKRFISPIHPDGSYPKWFLKNYPHYFLAACVQHTSRLFTKCFRRGLRQYLPPKSLKVTSTVEVQQ
jgi:type IV secretory pathway TraG/TraD family ATPase VirD4